MPPILGAIDAGSNGLRLAIARAEGGRLRVFDTAREPLRLGADVLATGRLSPGAIERAAAALAGFRARLDAAGTDRVRAVATHAVRAAGNGDELVARVRERSGLDLEVIDAAEEARLSLLAASTKVDLSRGRSLLLDLGGGSLEALVVTDGAPGPVTTLPVGAVRLLSMLDEAGGDLDALRAGVARALEVARPLLVPPDGAPFDRCVAVGGNPKALARLAHPERDDLGRGRLDDRDLAAWAARLQALPLSDRVDRLGLRPDRADVIVPAAVLLREVLRLSGAPALIVPKVGLVDGVLADLRSPGDAPPGSGRSRPG